MTVRCRRVLAVLPAFAGGDLAPAMVEPVREHLRRCDRCRREASRLLQSTRALGAALAQGPALGEGYFTALHRHIVAAVSTSATGADRPAAARIGGPSWMRRLGGLAAAAVLFAGGFLLHGIAAGEGLRGRSAIQVQEVKVVPWSGERMPQVRLLGLEEGSAPAECGSGMMGRLRLHTLEDLDEPERPPARDDTAWPR